MEALRENSLTLFFHSEHRVESPLSFQRFFITLTQLTGSPPPTLVGTELTEFILQICM
jgi:hypothetical protein